MSAHWSRPRWLLTAAPTGRHPRVRRSGEGALLSARARQAVPQRHRLAGDPVVHLGHVREHAQRGRRVLLGVLTGCRTSEHHRRTTPAPAAERLTTIVTPHSPRPSAQGPEGTSAGARYNKPPCRRIVAVTRAPTATPSFPAGDPLVTTSSTSAGTAPASCERASHRPTRTPRSCARRTGSGRERRVVEGKPEGWVRRSGPPEMRVTW